MQEHTIMVAGFDYHQKELAALLYDENYDYTLSKSEFLDAFDEDDKVYQYEVEEYDLHIEAEPTNQYDPNAVKVYADKTFVGYVPRGKFGDLKHLASIPGIKASVRIFGGKYKYIEYDADADYLGTLENKYYKVMTDSAPYKAVMVFEW